LFRDALIVLLDEYERLAAAPMTQVDKPNQEWVDGLPDGRVGNGR
jgi:hypothetical protein